MATYTHSIKSLKLTQVRLVQFTQLLAKTSAALLHIPRKTTRDLSNCAPNYRFNNNYYNFRGKVEHEDSSEVLRIRISVFAWWSQFWGGKDRAHGSTPVDVRIWLCCNEWIHLDFTVESSSECSPVIWNTKTSPIVISSFLLTCQSSNAGGSEVLFTGCPIRHSCPIILMGPEWN